MSDDRGVALIRGINVGRAKRVAMSELRALVEGLGYSGVQTVLNSGNVVFTAPTVSPREAAARIEHALETQLGVPARVLALTSTELDEIIRDNPLTGIADDPSRLLVAVLADPADRARLEPLAEREWAPEALALGRRVAYLWCPEGVMASRVMEAVNRTLGDAVTTRNWATLAKIHALAMKPN
ncbi:DUF1697 domain-containing protein [Thermomicrobiaceae bacterium CFH 74404]|uniref:DUF1697 domain-containing protein n=1 Tax=Thermalbibacter longus TaxID=2951981 RepID=A0AA41WG14_9BACT|nr:DUF1697 domain-containing protein [Thermalbibacter longus]MCM8750428.1 DUF1697 domain-containing protein [Thermalbibacter longus]